jgi:hypothetical protein
LFVYFRVTRPLPKYLKRKEKNTMAEKKAEKKVVGMTEGVMALAFFVLAVVLGLLAQ